MSMDGANSRTASSVLRRAVDAGSSAICAVWETGFVGKQRWQCRHEFGAEVKAVLQQY